MEIWLSNGINDKLQIPVNPSSIGYEDSRYFEDIRLADGNEKTIIGGRNQRSYSIESYFPAVRPAFAEVANILQPFEYVNKIKSWQDANAILLLQVTDTNINEQVTIRSFTWEERGGTVGDIDYTIELKEYQPVTFVTKYETTIGGDIYGGGGENRPPSTDPIPSTHIVKPNENLWNIARKYYKNGALYTIIYEANKQIIGPNPNLIKPGQKLVIPSG